MEATFRGVEGVLSTEAGYTGGDVANPTYQDVCSGRTGHAEAVRVAFDPEAVRYEELLDVFWDCHDPTQRNGQGPDLGTQYRSAIFAHDAQQRAEAAASMEQAQRRFGGRIVTQIVQASAFWPAEKHHQQYIERRGPGGCAGC